MQEKALNYGKIIFTRSVRKTLMPVGHKKEGRSFSTTRIMQRVN
jgi:hypothetical protein